MSGCFLGEYEIARTKEQKGLPSDGALIKSIVSSNMSRAIADYYGIELVEVLTGFKYIGRKMLEFEQKGKEHTFSDLKKATAALSEPMQEIRMPLWQVWHYVRQQHSTRERE